MPYADKEKQLECARKWKQKKRAENIAQGLRSDGAKRKPRQTKEERAAYMKAYSAKRYAERKKANEALGLNADGTPRKRKRLTPEERAENKRRLCRESHARHKEKYLEQQRQSRESNREEYNARRAQSRRIRLLCPEKREAHNKRHREYRKERRESDHSFKLLNNMRTLMYIAISGRSYKPGKDYRKSKSTMAYIGCTIQELREHLEGQFVNGMCWENYGQWHVDHIKPLAMFDMSNESHRHEAWHYTNLQPMWATDNIRKGARYVG